MKKDNTGITLMVLIITIVVLLILAAATISAVNSESIFNHTQDAVDSYVIEAEKESIKFAIAEWQIKKEQKTTETFLSFMKRKLIDIINSEADVTENNGILTIRTNHNNVFTADENGNVTLITNDDSEPNSNTGSNTEPGQGEGSNNSWSYDSNTGKFTNGTTEYEYGDTISHQDVLNALGITENTGTYAGTWSVIGIENNRLKLVSTENVSDENVLVGSEDPDAVAAVPQESGYLTDREKKLRAENSYIHYIEKMNNEAKRASGISSARSIKIQDIQDILEEPIDLAVDPAIPYGTLYSCYVYKNDNYYYLGIKYSKDEGETWTILQNRNYYGIHYFIDENGNELTISPDEQYLNKPVTLRNTGFYFVDLKDSESDQLGEFITEGDFGLADICVNWAEQEVEFSIPYLDSYSLYGTSVFTSKYSYFYNYRVSVRAIIYI